MNDMLSKQEIDNLLKVLSEDEMDIIKMMEEDMATYKKGDKFIIEIEDIYHTSNGDIRYKMTGFNTLMFDKNGLDKLEHYKERPKVTNNDKFKEIFGRSIEVWLKEPTAFKSWGEEEYINPENESL